MSPRPGRGSIMAFATPNSTITRAPVKAPVRYRKSPLGSVPVVNQIAKAKLMRSTSEPLDMWLPTSASWMTLRWYLGTTLGVRPLPDLKSIGGRMFLEFGSPSMVADRAREGLI